MRHFLLRSLAEYPGHHLVAAIKSTGAQLAMVATGEGVHWDLMHTHRIIEHYLPHEAVFMKTSRQHRGELSLASANDVHLPVAWGSMLMVAAFLAHAIWRQRFDDFALLTGTVTLAILGNAFVCGVLSGPHDRYGSRMAWIATFTVLIVLLRGFSEAAQAAPARNASTPSL
jgi:hypothetical protein